MRRSGGFWSSVIRQYLPRVLLSLALGVVSGGALFYFLLFVFGFTGLLFISAVDAYSGPRRPLQGFMDDGVIYLRGFMFLASIIVFAGLTRNSRSAGVSSQRSVDEGDRQAQSKHDTPGC
jgi:hypothetical protein